MPLISLNLSTTVHGLAWARRGKDVQDLLFHFLLVDVLILRGCFTFGESVTKTARGCQ